MEFDFLNEAITEKIGLIEKIVVLFLTLGEQKYPLLFSFAIPF